MFQQSQREQGQLFREQIIHEVQLDSSLSSSSCFSIWQFIQSITHLSNSFSTRFHGSTSNSGPGS